MGKVYVGQADLTIRLTTGIDLTGTTCRIKYIKPNGAEGGWDAEIFDIQNGVIEYKITSSNEIDVKDEWTLWAQVTFSNGSVVYGEPCVITFYEEGK